MKKIVLAITIAVLTGTSCFSKSIVSDTNLSLSDKKATSETVSLYKKLNLLAQKGYLFGHQDDLAYGVNWKYENGRSDVKDVVGDYPAVYGWDIAGLERNDANNIDGIPFTKMKQYIEEANERGGISTISMHFDNPATGKSAWDNSPNTLKSILPGAENHQKFTIWLDKAAEFFLSLKDKKGKNIPILFRPYHELTGGWFWWGKGNGTPEEFKTLWKFTFDYLQKKGVHNLIYIYNTGSFNSKEDFLEKYPGDDYADILSFDSYQNNDDKEGKKFIEEVQNQLKIINEIGKKQNKLIAIAEAGYEAIPDPKWWTGTLTKAIGEYKISYVLLWRNHGWQEKEQKMHYYAPYPGQISAKDFVDFYKLDKTLFEKDIKKALK
ncbi:glycoside hydrolase family 26 protein [Flavobacterium hibernum]|uniref:Mannan endo-1,4-beta-mannosidase n=1 Tax=Flavobacterium hibernum TaxID=37752 RepID=A0A0D0EF11_9FLAO|nr:glycosyl hydrolase [Flavobacterium hibernum]KIO53294.1 beta-mannosidase [Flavobacterium hibernum]OXA87894.1 beta-mannosidase [Flavobacterium hibernum]STO10482.1 Mannan endo-1,4-beta-mannosidase precursor [Flavobacterium hibernum]